MANEMPLVSVIVPMYNAEKYVEVMMKSVLAQTLQDFELIIVDDCSTDGSRKIVESYIPKFDGRLKLISTLQNSGGAGVPRNKGLEFSRGKYIFFLDSDDALVETGLAEMVEVAEIHKPDYVIFKRNLTSEGAGDDFMRKAELVGDANDNTVGLVIGNFAQKVDKWVENFFEVYPWKKLLIRDFLIEKEIKFLPVLQEDSIWNFELTFSAERIILAPNVCCIHRERPDSLTNVALRKNLTVNGMRRKMDRIIGSIKHVDDFMNRFEFFRKDSARRYAVLNHMVMQNVSWIWKAHKDAPSHLIYENLREAFRQEFGERDVLIAYLISDCFDLLKKFKDTQAKLAEANASLAGG